MPIAPRARPSEKLSPDHPDGEYESKQLIQEGQYREAYHWRDTKTVEGDRYSRLSRLLADSVSQLADVKASRRVSICDFGCGDGNGSYQLWRILAQRQFGVTLVGADISEQAIAWASQQTRPVRDRGIDFLVGDINKALQALPDDGSPRVIVMREVIEHLPEDVLDRILSTVRQKEPSIPLLITTPSTNSPVTRKHFRHYSPTYLASTLERNGFQILTMNGFGLRPRPLYKPLSRIKRLLNKLPLVWWVMSPFWRAWPPRVAITLVCVASPSQGALNAAGSSADHPSTGP